MQKAHILNPDSHLTVSFDSGLLTIYRSNPLWDKAIEAFKSSDWVALETLMTPKTAISKWTGDKFSITEDGVFHDGERLPKALETRIVQFWQEGLPFEPLLRFWERLMANPSARAVRELYSFLEHKRIPINKNGYFLAYKAVQPNLMDIYSGKCYNGIGEVLEMPRRKVDDDANRTCSYGFHVGALDYVKWYGRSDSTILICEVDPADVVSIPADHAAQKVRTCKYKVVDFYTGPLPDTLWEPNTSESFDESWELEEELDDAEYFESMLEDESCPYCGDEISEYWDFCPACGGDLTCLDTTGTLYRDR